MRAPFVFLISLAAAWPLAASAYRPFNSTDAAIAPRGELEIEMGPVGYLKEGPDPFLVAPSLVLNWSFADRWQLVLEGRELIRLGSVGQERRATLQEAALTLKGILREGSLQEKTGPSAATELAMLIPTVDGESVGASGRLIASQRWDAATVHLNGEASWTRAHRLGYFAGAIVEGHDTWTVRPVAEVFVEGERGVPTTVSGLAGAIWRIRDGLSFDAALRRARTGGVNTTEIRVGFTVAFSVGFPR
jgi:hypothetical protein